MARAGRELNAVLRGWKEKLGGSGKWLEEFLLENKGRFFLLPLKQRLFIHGVSGDGRKLQPYSKDYAIWKKGMGRKSTPTTLRLFGNWYDSMYVKIGQGNQRHSIEILTRESAIDEPKKTTGLKRKYGAAILQITQEEQLAVEEAVAEEIVRVFEEDSNILFEFK